MWKMRRPSSYKIWQLENSPDESSPCVFAKQERDQRRLQQELVKEQMHLAPKSSAKAEVEEHMRSCSRGKGSSCGL